MKKRKNTSIVFVLDMEEELEMSAPGSGVEGTDQVNMECKRRDSFWIT